MTRSIWKGPFCEVNKSETNKNHQNLPNKRTNYIYSRRSVILPQFVGQTFYIHNGKTFISCNIVENMIGCKFGQFASTRSRSKIIQSTKINKNAKKNTTKK